MPRTGHFLLERAKRREQCLCPPMADALYCHSCSGPRGIDKFRGWAKAGIGTMQCERTRAMSEQLRILLLWTNRPIMAYQGNTVDPDLRRGDEYFWLG